MLSKRHRFHGYGSLRRVYQGGQSVRGQMINVRFAVRPGREYRVAVVVSRKVSKSAVVRNRIRRRIYEEVRRQADRVPPGADLVFTVFSEQVAELESERLRGAVDELLKKVAAQLPD